LLCLKFHHIPEGYLCSEEYRRMVDPNHLAHPELFPLD
jgi:hypothetical protein